MEDGAKAKGKATSSWVKDREGDNDNDSDNER
jgi:hypothetical protein